MKTILVTSMLAFLWWGPKSPMEQCEAGKTPCSTQDYVECQKWMDNGLRCNVERNEEGEILACSCSGKVKKPAKINP